VPRPQHPQNIQQPAVAVNTGEDVTIDPAMIRKIVEDIVSKLTV